MISYRLQQAVSLVHDPREQTWTGEYLARYQEGDS
jgi:hypothetical protein